MYFDLILERLIMSFVHDNVCKFTLWPKLPFEDTLKARTHMHGFFFQFFDIKVWWIFLKRLSKIIKFLLWKNVSKICLHVQDFKMEKAFHTKKPISYGKRVMVVMFERTSMQEWQSLSTRFNHNWSQMVGFVKILLYWGYLD